MSYIMGIKDFCSEMLTLKTSLKFKKMRLLSRFPKFRTAETDIDCSGRDIISEDVSNASIVDIDKDIDSVVREIKDKGFSSGFSLSNSALKVLLAFCNDADFFPERRASVRVKINHSDTTPPSESSIYSILNPHDFSETVREITSSRDILEIASKYLNATPVLLNSQIWYTFPQESKAKHHNFGFHYDIDDYRFLKFFFYLDDVDENTGPHVIIESSHKESSIFKFFNRRISDEVAESKYKNKIKVMLGKPGQGFAEDTFCYHKGTYPLKRRLILQVQFGISK